MMFRPHDKDEFSNLTSAELSNLYRERDSDPLTECEKLLTKIETAKIRVKQIMCQFKPISEECKQDVIKLCFISSIHVSLFDCVSLLLDRILHFGCFVVFVDFVAIYVIIC